MTNNTEKSFDLYAFTLDPVDSGDCACSCLLLEYLSLLASVGLYTRNI